MAYTTISNLTAGVFGGQAGLAQQQLGLAQQQVGSQYANAYESTGYTTSTIAGNPHVMTGSITIDADYFARALAREKKPETSLDWLDRRVNEMRVKL